MKKYFTTQKVTRIISVFLMIFWAYRLIQKRIEDSKNMIPFTEITSNAYRYKLGLPYINAKPGVIKNLSDSELNVIHLKLGSTGLRQMHFIKPSSVEHDEFLLHNGDTLKIGFHHPSQESVLGIELADSRGNSKHITFKYFYDLLKADHFNFPNDTLFYNEKIRNGQVVRDNLKKEYEKEYLQNHR